MRNEEGHHHHPIRVRLDTHEQVDPNTQQRTVHIVTTPERFRVTEGQPLIFGCDHPFTVDFVGADPLAGDLVDVRENEPNWLDDGNWQISFVLGQRVRPDAARLKRYKYSVSLYYEGQVYSVDPEGVVEPDPTKAGKV